MEVFSSFVVVLPLLRVFSIGGAEVPKQTISPDITVCRLAVLEPGSRDATYNCCLLVPPTPASPFTPPTPSNSASPKRIRAPVHSADPTYIAKLTRAYDLMKALPADDPRSFVRQAHLHCAYCSAVHNQVNSSAPFQAHFTWLFLPFHRFYLYFHERILANLLGDDSFALPFWNYDHPDGAHMPHIYLQPNSLYNPRRDHRHFPPSVASLDYQTYNAPPRPRDAQIRENSATLYRSLIRDSTSTYAYHGAPYRHGDLAVPGSTRGNAELLPHNTLHLWSGMVFANGTGGRDMGWFASSGFDTLFYAHHAEVDRLWDIWLSLPGNTHIDDPDYLDTEFLFYNEHAQMVKVKVRDALDLSRLGYAYEKVETPWLNAVPEVLSGGKPAKLSEEDSVCEMGKPIEKPCSVVLRRDARVVGGKQENLVVNGVKFARGMPFIMDVFLNLPLATAETTSGSHEFVGNIFNIPQFDPAADTTDSVLPLTERIKALELTQEEEIVVTFVPKGLDTGSAASITSISLELSG